jgi:hypothetical protein
MPQHSFEYLNTLRWFYDTFEHPLRLRLLYVAGSFINQAAWWVQNTPGTGAADTRPPRQQHLSQRHPEAFGPGHDGLKPTESVAWTRAYLKGGYDRQPLVQTLALGAVKEGNDTHNQEIALCLLEDYLHSQYCCERDILLLACAQHTAGHAVR